MINQNVTIDYLNFSASFNYQYMVFDTTSFTDVFSANTGSRLVLKIWLIVYTAKMDQVIFPKGIPKYYRIRINAVKKRVLNFSYMKYRSNSNSPPEY